MINRVASNNSAEGLNMSCMVQMLRSFRRFPLPRTSNSAWGTSGFPAGYILNYQIDYNFSQHLWEVE